MKILRLKIRKLDDGRFYVRYYWRFLEFTHRQYFDSLEDLQKFLTKLIKDTKWEG